MLDHSLLQNMTETKRIQHQSHWSRKKSKQFISMHTIEVSRTIHKDLENICLCACYSDFSQFLKRNMWLLNFELREISCVGIPLFKAIKFQLILLLEMVLSLQSTHPVQILIF